MAIIHADSRAPSILGVQMKLKRWVIVSLLILCVVSLVFRERLREATNMVSTRLSKVSVAGRLDQYGPSSRGRWSPRFQEVGVSYPPRRVVLVGLKQEKTLEVWAGETEGELKFIRAFPIRGMSGVLGPKLREGDKQVPEGLYGIDFLNPNSAYHLSLRISYPNDFDRRIALEEGRTDLGGDIFIHGGAASIGCLAMGDEAAEDLFILVAETGIDVTKVVLSPVDFRITDLPPSVDQTGWRASNYTSIRQELLKLHR